RHGPSRGLIRDAVRVPARDVRDGAPEDAGRLVSVPRGGPPLQTRAARAQRARAARPPVPVGGRVDDEDGRDRERRPGAARARDARGVPAALRTGFRRAARAPARAAGRMVRRAGRVLRRAALARVDPRAALHALRPPPWTAHDLPAPARARALLDLR